MTTPPNRFQLIAQSTAVTGLDFVFVHADQVTLDVRFLNDPSALDSPLVNDLDPGAVSIVPVEAGDPEVEIAAVSWTTAPGGENILRVNVARPGGFSPYRLAVTDSRIDPYFRSLVFSFKANCPRDVDCEVCPPECPPDDPVDFPVDYRARDFWSFRTALLDFASQRYPEWAEAGSRREADVGVMLAEAMSALGDELAYYQDRVGREAYLETATQRRSLRRHARLVDYRMHDGKGATGWLDVQASAAGTLPAGTAVWGTAASGEKTFFSVGHGLSDTANYDVRPQRNAIPAHIWHEDDICLPAGSTELFLTGSQAGELVFDDPADDPSGRWVLLVTDPADPSVPVRKQIVRITSVSEMLDPLIGTTVTRLAWEEEHATRHEMELGTLSVHANLAPITAGRTLTRRFTIGDSDSPGDRPAALERQGRNINDASASCACDEDSCGCEQAARSITFLFSLPETDSDRLVWLGASPEEAEPEIRLARVEDSGGGVWTEAQPWQQREAFIGTNSSQPLDFHYVLEDGTWARVAGYQRTGGEVVHCDYASGEGKTIRFGDGEFGRMPQSGDIFQATYRVGNGAATNLPAGAVSHIESGLPFVDSVSNPLPTAGGVEPQDPDEVRQLAPDAFRVETYRAVTSADYAAAVERLDWTQRAGAKFRWTGSWLTAFVTPDPKGAQVLSSARAREAREQLDRFRQAGRPVAVKGPRYVDLDLRITVCARPDAFRDEVAGMIIERLFGTGGLRPQPGFFSPDNFTFGDPLERSALEAAIQSAGGVLAVRSIAIRRQGWFDWRPMTELTYEVADDEVIRLENDPDHPDRGTLRLDMEGGA